jgi:high-affinity Fe2+/Pb2+ permease
MLAGALIGTLCAALLAWAWSHYGHRVNLARFFQVTSLFLVLFVISCLSTPSMNSLKAMHSWYQQRILAPRVRAVRPEDSMGKC